jgi:glycosyltransferase involved in cell wall biosynthesis
MDFTERTVFPRLLEEVERAFPTSPEFDEFCRSELGLDGSTFVAPEIRGRWKKLFKGPLKSEGRQRECVEKIARARPAVRWFATALEATARRSRSLASDPSDAPVARASAVASRPPERRLRILAVATEWHSRHGGLSTVNRELCAAFGGAGHEVYCLVPDASDAEVADAKSRGVTLLSAQRNAGSDPMVRLTRRAPLPPGFVLDVVIGHGRVTGDAARAQCEDHFAGSLRVHVVHTASGEIEWHKPSPGADVSARAQERERHEVDLARSADVAAAVGPRLSRELANLLHPHRPEVPEIVTLIPGLLPHPGRRSPPPAVQCLLLGRAEDDRLKGIDIAARAFARLRRQMTEARDAVLVVRGAAPGTAETLQHRLVAIVGGANSVRVWDFSAEVGVVEQSLLQASLVLMPSRSEGFGMVALEGISMGIPTLVSDQSGFAELLRSVAPAAASNIIVPVRDDEEHDAEEWARRMEFVLRSRAAAFDASEELRRSLSGTLAWERAMTALAEAIGRCVARRGGGGSWQAPAEIKR